MKTLLTGILLPALLFAVYATLIGISIATNNFWLYLIMGFITMVILTYCITYKAEKNNNN